MLKNYIKIAWKVLLRRKFFTFISLFGISFTLMILMVITSMTDHVFGARSPESQADRMLGITEIKSFTKKGWNSQNALSYEFLKKYIKTLKTPEKITLFSNLNTVNAFIGNNKLILDQRHTDEVFWEVFDFKFIEGGEFNVVDVDRANMVAVINENTKNEYFGATPAVGKQITIDGKNYTVSGVVKNVPISNITTYADVWVPFSTAPAKLKEFNVYHGQFNAVLLAKNENDFPLIKDEVQRVLDHINSLPHPEMDRHYIFAETMAENLSRHLLGDGTEHKYGLLLFLATLMMLLFMLLPTINLININISRIMERTSEIGVRRAFGATKINLVGQFLVENLFLTLLGCIIGFVMSYLILELINRSQIIAYANFGLNGTVFFYGLVMTIIFGLISGVYPAYKMSKLQAVDALKGGTL